MLKLLVTSCLLILIAGQDDINTSTFPEDFLFGTATSAYQIEGSWKADGKGENNWDRFIRTDPNSVIDNSTADIACDSYHKYREDVEQLKTIGAQFYRFSLSWSRILPNGFTNEINQKGVAYYKSLIKELKSNGIIPFVTLHHFDTPQPLEDLGGWTDEQIVQRYSEYARLCFRLFGDDVKHWLTINEPKQLCYMGYGLGLLAPGTRSPGAGEYECDRNVVLAHAGACKIYREEFRAEQQGEIGMVIDTPWFQPANASSPGDIEASERQLQFTYGLYANPIVYGDYPEVVKEVVLRRSLAQNYTASRLRGFTEEQKAALKGSYDFLCLNYYTSYMVQEDPEVDPEGKGYQSDPETDIYFDPDWESTVSEVFKVVPWGIRKVLRWMRETYGNPAIYVTENGYPSDGTIDDQKRIRFIKEHLSNVKDAMDKDGVNVKGYSHWSLMDDFEWNSGYTIRFGLYYVDFENQTRTPKSSATYYKNIISTRRLTDEDKRITTS
nr:glycoside hydrolase family 1 [Phyllotreta armoraciae]